MNNATMTKLRKSDAKSKTVIISVKEEYIRALGMKVGDIVLIELNSVGTDKK